jgi:hypothetical protein
MAAADYAASILSRWTKRKIIRLIVRRHRSGEMRSATATPDVNFLLFLPPPESISGAEEMLWMPPVSIRICISSETNGENRAERHGRHTLGVLKI